MWDVFMCLREVDPMTHVYTYVLGVIWAYVSARILSRSIRGSYDWRKTDARIALVTCLGSWATFIVNALAYGGLKLAQKWGAKKSDGLKKSMF